VDRRHDGDRERLELCPHGLERGRVARWCGLRARSGPQHPRQQQPPARGHRQIDASFTPALFKTAYQTVLTAIRGQASKPYIILVGLPPMETLPTTQYLAFTPAWASSRQNAIAQYNQVIQQLAWDNGARYASLQGLNYAAYGILGINIHQTLAGQTFIAQRIIEAINGF
jgi:hypothetical protein